MKRSEMVKSMATELILAWCDVYDDPQKHPIPDFGKAQEIAEFILIRMVNEGMKPPLDNQAGFWKANKYMWELDEESPEWKPK